MLMSPKLQNLNSMTKNILLMIWVLKVISNIDLVSFEYLFTSISFDISRKYRSDTLLMMISFLIRGLTLIMKIEDKYEQPKYINNKWFFFETCFARDNSYLWSDE
jgi:hypothetical protein